MIGITHWSLRRWLESLGAAILVGLVGYSLFAYPWSGGDIYCLRSATGEAAAALRFLTAARDGAFTGSYSWIPISLVLVWIALKVKPAGPLLVLFGLFIVLCGATHGFKIYNLYAETPNYWGAMKLSACGGAVSLVVGYVTHRQKRPLISLGDQGGLLREQTAKAEERAARIEAMQSELQEKAATAELARLQAEGLALDLKKANAEKDVEIAKNAALLAELNIARDQANQRAQRAEGAIDTVAAERDDAQKHAEELRALNARLELAIREASAAAERIDLQAAAIEELEIPVVPLWIGVLLLPLVGPMDSTRAQRLTEGLLEAVVTHSARVVILDLTGVRVVDTAVAGALTMTAKAVKLVGSECVITGISGDIAMTVVKLGLEFGIVTLRDVQEGLALAMKRVSPTGR